MSIHRNVASLTAELSSYLIQNMIAKAATSATMNQASQLVATFENESDNSYLKEAFFKLIELNPETLSTWSGYREIWDLQNLLSELIERKENLETTHVHQVIEVATRIQRAAEILSNNSSEATTPISRNLSECLAFDEIEKYVNSHKFKDFEFMNTIYCQDKKLCDSDEEVFPPHCLWKIVSALQDIYSGIAQGDYGSTLEEGLDRDEIVSIEAMKTCYLYIIIASNEVPLGIITLIRTLWGREKDGLGIPQTVDWPEFLNWIKSNLLEKVLSTNEDGDFNQRRDYMEEEYDQYMFDFLDEVVDKLQFDIGHYDLTAFSFDIESHPDVQRFNPQDYQELYQKAFRKYSSRFRENPSTDLTSLTAKYGIELPLLIQAAVSDNDPRILIERDRYVERKKAGYLKSLEKTIFPEILMRKVQSVVADNFQEAKFKKSLFLESCMKILCMEETSLKQQLILEVVGKLLYFSLDQNQIDAAIDVVNFSNDSRFKDKLYKEFCLRHPVELGDRLIKEIHGKDIRSEVGEALLRTYAEELFKTKNTSFIEKMSRVFRAIRSLDGQIEILKKMKVTFSAGSVIGASLQAFLISFKKRRSAVTLINGSIEHVAEAISPIISYFTAAQDQHHARNLFIACMLEYINQVEDPVKKEKILQLILEKYKSFFPLAFSYELAKEFQKHLLLIIESALNEEDQAKLQKVGESFLQDKRRTYITDMLISANRQEPSERSSFLKLVLQDYIKFFQLPLTNELIEEFNVMSNAMVLLDPTDAGKATLRIIRDDFLSRAFPQRT